MPRFRPPPTSQYKPNESQICIAFVDYVNSRHASLSEDLIHIPNENRCSWPEGKKLKAMGKRAGVSDYFFARAKRYTVYKVEGYYEENRLYFGLWLEFKSEKGKCTLSQKSFGERQLAKGYQYKVVYSLDEAIAVFEEYVSLEEL